MVCPRLRYERTPLATKQRTLTHPLQEPPSRHRDFLRWIPLHSSSKSLITQRKVTLHGIRVRETPEDLNERSIRKELRSLLPELFSGTLNLPWKLGWHIIFTFISVVDVSVDIANPRDATGLLSATRYEQIRVLNDWLTPILKKALSRCAACLPAKHASDLRRSTGTQSPLDPNNHLLRPFCIVVELMAHCKCYGSIYEVRVAHTHFIAITTYAPSAMRSHASPPHV